MSPLGWAILALGVLCWYVGVRFGWVELLVVAAACGVLVLACLALTIGRVHVDIHSEVDPRRVTVGDPATGRIVVRNLARTPLLPLLVELPVGVTAARFVMPPMRAGAEHEELFVVPTHRRGVIAVGPATYRPGRPLGVLRRRSSSRRSRSSSSTRVPPTWSRSAPACCATSRARSPRTTR